MDCIHDILQPDKPMSSDYKPSGCPQSSCFLYILNLLGM